MQGHKKAVQYLLDIDNVLWAEPNDANQTASDCVKHQLAAEARGERRKRLKIVLEVLEPGATVPTKTHKPKLGKEAQAVFACVPCSAVLSLQMKYA